MAIKSMLSIVSDQAASSTQKDVIHILYLERLHHSRDLLEALLSQDICISPEQECGVIQTLKKSYAVREIQNILFSPSMSLGP